MNNEEYYKRLEKINNRFKTDRVSADEEYYLVCQKNYLSTKYIEHLEQQCKKQKEVIDKAIEYISNKKAIINTDVIRIFDLFEIDEQGYTNKLLDILKEAK